jgi:hypothetical protein
MAMITAIKPLCVTCSKERGVFKCEGCSQLFCPQHTATHRKNITEQLEDVEDNRIVVEMILTQQLAESRKDEDDLKEELLKTIDTWEQDSIAKIKRRAEETRSEVFQHTSGRLDHKKIKLQQLTEELQQSRQTNDFVETDLRAWTDKLNRWKEEIVNPPKVVVRQESTALVTQIQVNAYDTTEVFERASSKVALEDNDKVAIVQDGPELYAEVRGRVEYVSGQHALSFKAEKLNGWTLFGIISKSTLAQEHSYASPSCYGWYNGEGFVYAGGQNIGGQGHDIAQNDTVNVLIDCDHRLIRLTNERTHRTLELLVDLDQCTFPWQMHLNLNLTGTCIRILS